MDTENARYVEAVAKLIELTNDGELVWRPAEGDDLTSYLSTSHLRTLFIADHKGKHLRLTERFEDRSASSVYIITSYGLSSRSGFVLRLEIVDDLGLTVWAFPQLGIIHELLEVVRQKVADLDEFIDDLLLD